MSDKLSVMALEHAGFVSEGVVVDEFSEAEWARFEAAVALAVASPMDRVMFSARELRRGADGKLVNIAGESELVSEMREGRSPDVSPIAKAVFPQEVRGG